MNQPCLSKCCIQFDWCSAFSNSCDNASSNAGPIIGGVIGGIFLLIILAVGIVCFYRRRMAAQLLTHAANKNDSETTIIMTNKQPAYGVNQSYNQSTYNQINSYNQAPYNPKAIRP